MEKKNGRKEQENNTGAGTEERKEMTVRVQVGFGGMGNEGNKKDSKKDDTQTHSKKERKQK